MDGQSQQKILYFQRFISFYNVFRPKWPSSGSTTVYGIRGRNLSTLSIVKKKGDRLSCVKCSNECGYIIEINPERRGTAGVWNSIFAVFNLY